MSYSHAAPKRRKPTRRPATRRKPTRRPATRRHIPRSNPPHTARELELIELLKGIRSARAEGKLKPRPISRVEALEKAQAMLVDAQRMSEAYDRKAQAQRARPRTLPAKRPPVDTLGPMPPRAPRGKTRPFTFTIELQWPLQTAVQGLRAGDDPSDELLEQIEDAVEREGYYGRMPRRGGPAYRAEITVNLTGSLTHARRGLSAVTDAGDELLEQIEDAANLASHTAPAGTDATIRADILDALAVGGGSQVAAAKRLGMPRSTFRYHMKRLGIAVP